MKYLNGVLKSPDILTENTMTGVEKEILGINCWKWTCFLLYFRVGKSN